MEIQARAKRGSKAELGVYEMMGLMYDTFEARISQMQAELDELRNERSARPTHSAKTKATSRNRWMPRMGNDAAFAELEKSEALARERNRAMAVAEQQAKLQRKIASRPNRRLAQALLDGEVSASSSFTIDIEGEIEDHTAKQVRDAIKAHPCASQITVNIDSDGGSLRAASEIIQMLETHTAHVHTHAKRRCSSAANSILLAGDRRTADRDCDMFLHRPVMPNCTHETPTIRAQLDALQAALAQRYSERTSKPTWWWQRLMSLHGTTLSTARAKAYAIVHDIVQPGGLCAA